MIITFWKLLTIGHRERKTEHVTMFCLTGPVYSATNAHSHLI